MDEQGVVARGSVVSADLPPCGGEVYEVKFETLEPLRPIVPYQTHAFADLDAGDAARKLPQTGMASPSGHPNDTVWIAVDGDGDGVEDVLATSYACADRETPTLGATTSYCVDIYRRARPMDAWERVAHDAYAFCQ
jgi:hypothetical protein